MKSYQKKTDCIIYDKENRYCKGLTYLVCAAQEKCPFYKSNKEYNDDGTKRVGARKGARVKD